MANRHPSQRATSRSFSANTSGRTFEHLQCLEENPSLNAARALRIKCSHIRTETLDITHEAMACTTPMHVALVLKVTSTPSLETTAYSLTLTLAETCTKTFEFLPGAEIQIPTSSNRETVLSVRLQQPEPTDAFDFQLGVIDVGNERSVLTADTMLLPQKTEGYFVIAAITEKARTNSVKWKFPCVVYKRDCATPRADEDMQSLGNDFLNLRQRSQLLPAENITIISHRDAQAHVQKLEYACNEFMRTLHDCRYRTLEAELGVSGAHADALMKRVDWPRSYCVPSDTHLAELISLAKDIHNRMDCMSQLAVDCAWFFDTKADAHDSVCLAVREATRKLLCTRSEIASVVAGRRKDLQSVVRVRTCFLLLSAIDQTARSVCGMTKRSTGGLFAADDIMCHSYWLKQMQNNTSNSVTMEKQIYTDAQAVLCECQRVLNSGIVLVPDSACKLSPLSLNAWQSMHLQGLACRDALVIASAPHFLYKQRQIVNYTDHPNVIALRKRATATAQQLESAKLFATLVSADVEHRIITKHIQHFINRQWELACQNSSVQAHQEALQNVCALLDPSVTSLVLSAFDTSVTADISFLTQAHLRPGITGYDMQRLAAIEAEHWNSALQ